MVDVRDYGNDCGSYRDCRLEIGVVGRFVRLDLRSVVPPRSFKYRSFSVTIIAVTTGNDDGANRYLEVIEKLGAIPTRLTPGSETSLQQVDGLLLTGGPDVAPTR